MVCPFTRLWNIRQDTWFFVRLSFLIYLYIYAIFCQILVLQLDDKRMNIQKSFQTLGLVKAHHPEQQNQLTENWLKHTIRTALFMIPMEVMPLKRQ